ncbi:putative membrane protein [Clostridium sp. CAG:269]|jgi:uncharacterized membrane protein ykvI|nr:hypothetical protein [Clostridia bacterium]CDE56098.1 putative membrane protein [Clostridium sp. CAG:269]
MIEVISITLVIIGALIGAGFASGQEIFSFFYIYGKNGIYGILIMSILIGIFIYKSLKIIYQKQVYNYNDFLNLFIKNTKIRNVILWIVNVLLLVSFYIMVAGFGAYFEQEIGINRIIGSIVLNLLCVIVFFSNIKGVLKASNFIVPFLIFFIFFIGIKNIVQIRTIDFYQMKNNWILSMLIYNSYNFILLMPVLISLKKQITKEKNIKKVSILVTIIILILSISIFFLLLNANIKEIENQEMPIVYIISNYFNKYKKIYAFIVLASIFTTAISVGIGFLQNISKNSNSYPQFVLFMCITSLLMSNIGFSKLLNFIYPVFGYIGILQIVIIFFIN